MRQIILIAMMIQFLFYEYPSQNCATSNGFGEQISEPEPDDGYGRRSDDDNPEPQHFSWELGEPDNRTETEIIYEESVSD